MLNVKKARKSMIALSLAVTLGITGIGGLAAHGLQAAEPAEKISETKARTPEVIINADDYGNPLPPTRLCPEGTELPPGFTWYKNMLFWDSLPTRRVDHAYNSDDADNPEMIAWEVIETISDYDPTLLFFREIMSHDLADRLWESEYLKAYEVKMWGFRSFFTSDQFVELLEHFGDRFVEDLLGRDVLETLELLMGDGLEDFLAEAYAIDRMSEVWMSIQNDLVENQEAFVRRHLGTLLHDYSQTFENNEAAVQYFTTPTSMVHFPLPARVAVLTADGAHATIATEWAQIIAASEEISEKTVLLNNRSFMSQHVFEQGVMSFVREAI